jgi:hypothetical protein
MKNELNHLPFSILRKANLARLPRFKDRSGRLCHSEPDGSDWSAERWMNAMYGECGEASGELKKAARGDYGQEVKIMMDEQRYKDLPEKVKLAIAREFADIVTYLDLTASQFGIDLGAAVVEKFNLISVRVDAGIFIEPYADGDELVIVDEHSAAS